jgi:hypothetical protein
MQCISAALHGTLGSHLRDALQEGSADAVVCRPVPRALACGVFSSLLLFAWWYPPMPFILVNNFFLEIYRFLVSSLY